MKGLYKQPITQAEAKAFIARHHRHNIPPVGWVLATCVCWKEAIVGVMTLGRPSRMAQDGWTCEVTRVCIDPDLHAAIEAEMGEKPPVASMLYGAARRAAQAIGYRSVLTKSLDEESSTSIKAAGFEFIGMTKAESWDRVHRPRTDKAPVVPKKRWRIELTEANRG